MFKWNEIYWKIGVSLTITFLDRENSTLVRVIVIATKFPYFQASLDPGEATGWDVGDLFTLPVAFLPKSFYHQPLFKPYPPSFQPYPMSFKQAPLPTQSSFQPPLLLPTRCLSRLHVFMDSRRPNPCLSHIQDVSRRESRAEQSIKRQIRRLWERSL